MRNLIYIIIILVVTGCRLSVHRSDNLNGMNTNEATTFSNNNFVSCVLLSEPKWDKNKLIEDLKNEWNISSLTEQDNDILAGEFDDCTVGITLIPNQIPNGEAERYAEYNYLWSGGVEIIKSHKAYLLITVLGNGDVIETAKITTKLIDASLQQEKAIAVFNDVAVYQPQIYHEAAQSLHEDKLPLYNWIWLGIHNNGDIPGIYTDGLRQFGKEEIEVYGDAKLEDIYEFVFDVASYIINYDITLKTAKQSVIPRTKNSRLPLVKVSL